MAYFQYQIITPKLVTEPPVLFDRASTSGYEATLSTYNWTHVTGSDRNRIMMVGVGIFATGTVSSIKYGTEQLTFLRADVNGIYRSEIWYLIAPNSGSDTITVTLSASLTSVANAATYAGVDQIDPFSANAGANGTNTPASASITPTTARNRVFGNLAEQTANSTTTSSVSQAARTENGGALGTNSSDDKGIVDAAALTTLTWNGQGALDSWAISLAALEPVQNDTPAGFGAWATNPISQPYIDKPNYSYQVFEPYPFPVNTSGLPGARPITSTISQPTLIPYPTQPNYPYPSPVNTSGQPGLFAITNTIGQPVLVPQPTQLTYGYPFPTPNAVVVTANQYLPLLGVGG